MEIANKKKMYTEKKIFTATFLGGPLVAGYMLAHNYKILGKEDKIMQCWFICIAFTIALFTIVFMIPEDWKIPNVIIPLSYSFAARFITNHLQSRDIETFVSQGGILFGWGRAIVVSLIGLFVTFLAIVVGVFAAEYIDPDHLATKTYGKVENEISYNADMMSEADVDSFAENLSEINFFDSYATKYVYLQKEGKTYSLSVFINEEFVDDTELGIDLRGVKLDLEDLYPNHKIVVNIVVDNYDNIVREIE